MSNTTVTQSTPAIVNYTLQELIDMPSTLNGEQFPLNLKTVEKLEEDIYVNGLLQILEVTKLNDQAVLSGGRHRREALAKLYSDLDPNTVTLSVLEYAVSTANELVARVTSSNGSRRMVGAETKELVVASKFGFDTLTVESLIAQVNSLDDIDTFVLALALQLNDTYDMGKNTALVFSRSLVTKLKAIKITVTNDAIVDVDGTVLAPATKSKLPLLAHTFSSGSDSVEVLIDSIVNSIDYLSVMPHTVPLTIYTEALTLGMVAEVDLPEGLQVESVTTTVHRPTTLQRNAAKFVKVLLPGLKSYLSEALEVTI